MTAGQAAAGEHQPRQMAGRLLQRLTRRVVAQRLAQLVKNYRPLQLRIARKGEPLHRSVRDAQRTEQRARSRRAEPAALEPQGTQMARVREHRAERDRALVAEWQSPQDELLEAQRRRERDRAAQLAQARPVEHPTRLRQVEAARGARGPQLVDHAQQLPSLRSDSVPSVAATEPVVITSCGSVRGIEQDRRRHRAHRLKAHVWLARAQLSYEAQHAR